MLFRTQSRIEVILTISVYFYNTCHTRTADFSALTHPRGRTCMSHASRPWTWDRSQIRLSGGNDWPLMPLFLFFFPTLLSLGSLLHACPSLCLSNFKVDRKNHARFGGPSIRRTDGKWTRYMKRGREGKKENAVLAM